MKIAVRLDDITSDLNWDKFKRMEALLEKYKICPLMGVVPNNKDTNLKCGPEEVNYIEKLKQWEEKGWVMAMHGWEHLYSTKKGGLFPLNHFSEFAGISLPEQQRKIKEGKAALKKLGIDTGIFMAPAHSYDSNTLKALKENGFTHITDGFGNMPYQWRGLTFLPIAFRKDKDIKKDSGYTTLVFHVNTMDEQEFKSFEKILEEHKKDFISYGEYLQVKPVKQTFAGRIKEYVMAAVKQILVAAASGM